MESTIQRNIIPRNPKGVRRKMTSHNIPQGTPHNTISLMIGHPDPTTLLTPDLLKAMQDTISSPQAYTALQYGAEQGAQSLIDVLQVKIQREQGLSLQPANLMIVAGSTHAVDMLTRLYAKRGGVVLVEAPTYVDALHIFRDHQVELYSIPTDDNGLIPGELAKQLERLHSRGIVPSFLYTIPNFHNPKGSTLPEARRIEIIELAHRYGFLIIEDDVYRDLSFEGTVPASFYALANGKQVLSIGSFSKTLAPGLRLGWLLGSEDAIQRCVNCGTTQMGGGANPFAAQIVAAYSQHGFLEEHIAHVKTLYKMRRDVALSALNKYMPADVKWTHPTGGFFIWLTLPKTVFAQDVKRIALQQGLLVAAGEGFFANPSDGTHNLRLAYSCATPSDIDTGIHILAQVIDVSRRAEP
jgi:2-aminoadipate transaminase